MSHPREHDAGGDPDNEHEDIRIERGGERERAPRGGSEPEHRRIHPRTPPLDPQSQSGGLVVLELEQMQHEVHPAGEHREQAERGGHEARGRHRFAASRGCSSRNRRATARNWPGESA